jgi:hypothetical protein
MADRIIAKVFTPRQIQARSVAIGVGTGVNLADLADVVIPPANMVTGALMSYDAQTGGFIVLKDIDSPNLKLIGGSF